MNYIFPLVFLLGVEISIDDIMINFKGYSKYKKHITYKSEGGGFQKDSLFQDGFI